jgi:hypothetical protein
MGKEKIRGDYDHKLDVYGPSKTPISDRPQEVESWIWPRHIVWYIVVARQHNSCKPREHQLEFDCDAGQIWLEQTYADPDAAYDSKELSSLTVLVWKALR